MCVCVYMFFVLQSNCIFDNDSLKFEHLRLHHIWIIIIYSEVLLTFNVFSALIFETLDVFGKSGYHLSSCYSKYISCVLVYVSD